MREVFPQIQYGGQSLTLAPSLPGAPSGPFSPVSPYEGKTHIFNTRKWVEKGKCDIFNINIMLLTLVSSQDLLCLLWVQECRRFLSPQAYPADQGDPELLQCQQVQWLPKMERNKWRWKDGERAEGQRKRQKECVLQVTAYQIIVLRWWWLSAECPLILK